jgi:uncharacterized alpha-E superfamily protein
MLSRTAAALYWIGRYVERADFTARLTEATIRLDALSSRPAGAAAWTSALTVIDAVATFDAFNQPRVQRHVAPFLTISQEHAGSMLGCIEAARRNARAVRTALSREAWSAINNAWLRFGARDDVRDLQSLLALVEAVQTDTLAFMGALERMLHHPSSMFVHLGAAIERADNTARMMDVKYHILLPEGESVGGVVDRDQWTTLLQTVSAVNAYRLLYRVGLNASDVVEFLTLRPELPRSLISCMSEVVEQLRGIAGFTGFFGAADALAMTRLTTLERTRVPQIIARGLHEYLEDFLQQNAKLDEAIVTQFRF